MKYPILFFSLLAVGCEYSVPGVTTPSPYTLAVPVEQTLYGATVNSIWTGKVISVTDGDTIKVVNDQNEQIKIRLDAIDTPETNQPFGTVAKDALSKMLNGYVVVHETRKDQHGQTLAFIEIVPKGIGGGPSHNPIANAEMIRGGYALHYKKYNKDETLARLEAEAQVAKRGLWAGQSDQD